MRSYKFYGVTPKSKFDTKVFGLVEPILRAEQELRDMRVAGVSVDPDYYYTLVLTITGDKKKARNLQSELLLAQMANIPNKSYS